MNPFMFETDYILLEMEADNRLDDAAHYIYHNWQNNKSDLVAFLRASTQLWYTISMKDYDMGFNIGNDEKGASFLAVIQYYSNLLDEVIESGTRQFSNSAYFNAFIGYIYRIHPYYFKSFKGNYDAFFERGTAMMQRAPHCEDADIIIETLQYEPFDGNEGNAYEDACARLWESIPNTTWGKNNVQQHFYTVLGGK